MVALTPAQIEIANLPTDARVFLSGPAGTGKTTSGVARLQALYQQGVPGGSILVLTPQRTLQEPYQRLLNSPLRQPGGEAVLVTIGGLARRACDLFWSLAAGPAGFAHPDSPPRFLTLETAQYYMARLVRPLLEQKGYFSSLTIDRNRLVSQILDNLNKAAVVGFAHSAIGAQLDAAWYGEPAQRRVYADAQECANLFRAYCLEHNLLDFSLQIETFFDILWREPIVRNYLVTTHRHIIYENVEEDMPRAHDLLREWLPECESALFIYDEEAGFRRFLGADAESGWDLGENCDQTVRFTRSFVTSAPVAELGEGLVRAILPESPAAFSPASPPADGSPAEALEILRARFFPELLDAIAARAVELVQAGIPPSEMVILAPYLSDALRFSVTNRLGAHGLPWRTHRPSRSLHDEPASRALLTLSALAHPGWGLRPPRADLAYALVQAIEGLDLVRAQLLTGIVYRLPEGDLAPFDGILSEMQERITFVFGNRYTALRDWILSYRAGEPLPLDHFLQKLFADLLSQPGFGFHRDLDPVRVAASLVESVRKFRQALEGTDCPDIGQEYLQMLRDGVIAAQYLEGWRVEDRDAILVAPAHTFLMMNNPVSVQFWLNPGSNGWYERLSQPLTHPYVLSRQWMRSEAGRVWTDGDEVQASREALACLCAGLLRRTRRQIILAVSNLGESGYEQRGDLLKAFQQVLRARGGSA